MNYHLVLFQVEPVPLGAPRPIRLKIDRKRYEVIMQDARARIDSKEKGSFYVNEKLSFVVEEEGNLFCVCKVIKIKT